MTVPSQFSMIDLLIIFSQLRWGQLDVQIKTLLLQLILISSHDLAEDGLEGGHQAPGLLAGDLGRAAHVKPEERSVNCCH